MPRGDKEETFGQISNLMLKLAGHATDEELAQEGQEQPDTSEKDDTVEQVGDPAVTKDKSAPAVTPPPAAVDEEASESYTGEQAMPSESKGHPTDEKLKEGPAKSASTMAEQFVQQGNKLESSIGALMKSMNKDAGTEEPEEPAEGDGEEKQAGEEPAEDEGEEKQAGEEPEEPEETEDTTIDLKQAGYEAAAICGAQIARQQEAEQEAELEKFAAMGIQDADMLAEMGDGAMMDVLGPPQEAAGEAGGGGLTIEDIKALAQALADGKAPETPEEQAIAEVMSMSASAPEEPPVPTAVEEVEETEEAPGGGDLSEAKLASAMSKLNQDQKLKLAIMAFQSSGTEEGKDE